MTEPLTDAPHLRSGVEHSLLNKVFTARLGNYLSFGIGGSTLSALRLNARRLVAVDTDESSVARIREHPEMAQAIAVGQAHILHVDLGPVGPWGMPKDASRRIEWPRYISITWKQWAALGEMPDLVYVDGRFRIAACLSVALVQSRTARGSGDARVLFHDICDDRPEYTIVLKYFDVIESADSLYYLKVKRELIFPELLCDFLQWQFDPR